MFCLELNRQRWAVQYKEVYQGKMLDKASEAGESPQWSPELQTCMCELRELKF